GDSGGPLVVQTDEGEKVLIRIVSYGIPSEHAEDKTFSKVSPSTTIGFI
ncbi:unnamed protein product, partial [Allacma fusca]